MPELLATYDQLVAIAGGSDRAARFLSTWCPPSYLGGGSLAALADDDCVRLVRNYDLSPDLNEGLLLRSAWSGRPVMGMVEFLWGLSDGINDAGLCVALAYGGRSDTAEGFVDHHAQAVMQAPVRQGVGNRAGTAVDRNVEHHGGKQGGDVHGCPCCSCACRYGNRRQT